MVRARACSVRGRAGPQRSGQSTVAAVTGSIEGGPRPGRPGRRRDQPSAATRTWWDAEADTYQREHEEFLGAARWIWGPEGWDEADLDLLWARPGALVLELGCGAGVRQPMAAAAREFAPSAWTCPTACCSTAGDSTWSPGLSVPVVQAHAGALPFATRHVRPGRHLLRRTTVRRRRRPGARRGRPGPALPGAGRSSR